MGDEEQQQEEEKDELEAAGLPFACHICRGDFKRPVVTKCEHYFCEKCALQRYAKNTKCAVCDAQTHGIFKPATKLQELLQVRAARLAAEAKEQQEQQGEIQDDNDEQ